MIVEIREIVFGLGCWLLYCSLETDASLEASCTFHGKKYRTGQSWHPYLEPQGVMYCLRCTCSQDSSVNCYQIQCPAIHCANPIRDLHQCCPRCPELHAFSGFQNPVNSSCQYNGTTYQHGDIFPNNELFPSRQSNQCTQCSCSEGQIYCGLMTCPEVLCASPQTIPDSCCQICKDNSFEKLTDEPHLNRGVRHSRQQCAEEDSGRRHGPPGVEGPPTGPSLELITKNIRPKGRSGSTVVKIILKEKHRKACLYNGKTYSHGEVWHPTIRHIVHLPCILCTCRDGKQDCQRMTCPKEYTCTNPEVVEGKCCRVCPEGKATPSGETNATQCKVSVYRFVPSSSTSEHPKENLRKVAIESESSEDVDIYTWKFVKGERQEKLAADALLACRWGTKKEPPRKMWYFLNHNQAYPVLPATLCCRRLFLTLGQAKGTEERTHQKVRRKKKEMLPPMTTTTPDGRTISSDSDQEGQEAAIQARSTELLAGFQDKRSLLEHISGSRRRRSKDD